MPLLTTLQVRDIMHKNGGHPAYTNKTTGHTGMHRRVKAYVHGNDKMVTALVAACGQENVTLPLPNSHIRSSGWQSVTVKCLLSQE